MATNEYVIDPSAANGRSKCKYVRCKSQIAAGSLRLGKECPNPFSSDEDARMIQWYHPACLFHHFANMRAGSIKAEKPEDFRSGWEDLTKAQQDMIAGYCRGEGLPNPPPKTPKKGAASASSATASPGPKMHKAATKKRAQKKRAPPSDDESSSGGSGSFDGSGSSESRSPPPKRKPSARQASKRQKKQPTPSSSEDDGSE